MEEYFLKQTHPNVLMMVVESIGDVKDDIAEMRLEIYRVDRSELPSLSQKYEYLRMATDAVPVVKLKE